MALARALAAKPNVLLLDEPLSALDWDMRMELQDEIIKAHLLLNTITLLVSHDVHEVKKLASTVILLKNGTVINIEWGNFNKLDSTFFDRQLDKGSNNPGEQLLEKMFLLQKKQLKKL